MADIADAKANINDVEVSADAALSEAFFEKVGGAINYLNTTTDDHETRITTLEAPNVSASATATTNPLVTGTLVSISITPSSSNVLVIPGGIFSTDNVTGSGATIELRRGATVLYSQIYDQSTDNITLPSFLDTGATADASNTYSIYVASVTGNPRGNSHYIHAIDIK